MLGGAAPISGEKARQHGTRPPGSRAETAGHPRGLQKARIRGLPHVERGAAGRAVGLVKSAQVDHWSPSPTG